MSLLGLSSKPELIQNSLKQQTYLHSHLSQVLVEPNELFLLQNGQVVGRGMMIPMTSNLAQGFNAACYVVSPFSSKGGSTEYRMSFHHLWVFEWCIVS